jgi:hypothetical protein
MFKVWCKDSSESFATNALEFATLTEAEKYAKDLYRRWTALQMWAILPKHCPQWGEEFTGFMAYDDILSNALRTSH